MQEGPSRYTEALEADQAPADVEEASTGLPQHPAWPAGMHNAASRIPSPPSTVHAGSAPGHSTTLLHALGLAGRLPSISSSTTGSSSNDPSGAEWSCVTSALQGGAWPAYAAYSSQHGSEAAAEEEEEVDELQEEEQMEGRVYVPWAELQQQQQQHRHRYLQPHDSEDALWHHAAWLQQQQQQQHEEESQPLLGGGQAGSGTSGQGSHGACSSDVHTPGTPLVRMGEAGSPSSRCAAAPPAAFADLQLLQHRRPRWSLSSDGSPTSQASTISGTQLARAGATDDPWAERQAQDPMIRHATYTVEAHGPVSRLLEDLQPLPVGPPPIMVDQGVQTSSVSRYAGPNGSSPPHAALTPGVFYGYGSLLRGPSRLAPIRTHPPPQATPRYEPVLSRSPLAELGAGSNHAAAAGGGAAHRYGRSSSSPAAAAGRPWSHGHVQHVHAGTTIQLNPARGPADAAAAAAWAAHAPEGQESGGAATPAAQGGVCTPRQEGRRHAVVDASSAPGALAGGTGCLDQTLDALLQESFEWVMSGSAQLVLPHPTGDIQQQAAGGAEADSSSSSSTQGGHMSPDSSSTPRSLGSVGVPGGRLAGLLLRGVRRSRRAGIAPRPDTPVTPTLAGSVGSSGHLARDAPLPPMSQARVRQLLSTRNWANDPQDGDPLAGLEVPSWAARFGPTPTQAPPAAPPSSSTAEADPPPAPAGSMQRFRSLLASYLHLRTSPATTAAAAAPGAQSDGSLFVSRQPADASQAASSGAAGRGSQRAASSTMVHAAMHRQQASGDASVSGPGSGALGGWDPASLLPLPALPPALALSSTPAPIPAQAPTPAATPAPAAGNSRAASPPYGHQPQLPDAPHSAGDTRAHASGDVTAGSSSSGLQAYAAEGEPCRPPADGCAHDGPHTMRQRAASMSAAYTTTSAAAPPWPDLPALQRSCSSGSSSHQTPAAAAAVGPGGAATPAAGAAGAAGPQDRSLLQSSLQVARRLDFRSPAPQHRTGTTPPVANGAAAPGSEPGSPTARDAAVLPPSIHSEAGQDGTAERAERASSTLLTASAADAREPATRSASAAAASVVAAAGQPDVFTQQNPLLAASASHGKPSAPASWQLVASPCMAPLRGWMAARGVDWQSAAVQGMLRWLLGGPSSPL